MGEDILEFIFKLASIITSTAIVGSFLLKLYNKLVIEPNNKMMTDTLIPINNTMEKLNDLMADSKNDRIILHDLNKNQDKELNNHSIRLTGLEVWRSEHKENHGK